MAMALFSLQLKKEMPNDPFDTQLKKEMPNDTFNTQLKKEVPNNPFEVARRELTRGRFCCKDQLLSRENAVLHIFLDLPKVIVAVLLVIHLP